MGTKKMALVKIGSYSIGDVPRIVGCVTQFATFSSISDEQAMSFDIAEVRVDKIGLKRRKLLDACAALEDCGVPVLATIRSRKEGGTWSGAESERYEWYMRALPVVSAIDVEIRGGRAKTLAVQARKLGKTVVGSYHNFKKTPTTTYLKKIVDEGRAKKVHIVKIATMINKPSDVVKLFELLRYRSRCPLCLIGMGRMGLHSRVSLACAGSCLTYGYVDASAAPGQFSAEELRRYLDEFGFEGR